MGGGGVLTSYSTIIERKTGCDNVRLIGGHADGRTAWVSKDAREYRAPFLYVCGGIVESVYRRSPTDRLTFYFARQSCDGDDHANAQWEQEGY